MYSERTNKKYEKLMEYHLEHRVKTEPNIYFNNEERIKEYKRTGDIEIKKEIIIRNTPLAIYIAKRLWHPKVIDMQELIAAGIVAISNAIEIYEDKTHFSTFARTCVSNAMLDYINDWLGEENKEIGANIKKYSKLVNEMYGPYADLRDKEIMDCVIKLIREKNGMSDDYAYEIKSRILSERITYQNKDIIENVPYEEDDDFDETEFMQENHDELFSKLKDREKKLIEYKYGFIDGQEHTLMETADYLGVSFQAIQQQEKRTIQKMRRTANICLKKVRQ
jgi:RNA polymerase sigma factor (sigma-70 family)